MRKPKFLPDSNRLIVEKGKLEGYLLNALHKDGASKAKFFRTRGFHLDEWEVFSEALRSHGAKQTVTSLEETRHGKKFIVECQIVTPDGKNPCILSVWIQASGRPPRLVTAHPNS